MKHFDWSLETPDLPMMAFRKGRLHPQTLEGGGGSVSPYQAVTQGMAQTVTNRDTAAFNRDLNLNNYSNPFGSQTQTQIGTGPSGAPVYGTTTTASPELQAQMQSLMGQTGQSGQINQTALGGLYNLIGQTSPQAAQDAARRGQQAAYASNTQYLDPRFSQEKTSLDAQLANQGITQGSEAYNNAMTNFNNTKQKAYSDAANQAELTGSQIGSQNFQNQIAGATNQAGLFGQMVGIGQSPYSNLSTIAGLMPGYSGPATISTQPADTAGYMNQQYQNQIAGRNASTASTNSLLGSLAGALATYGIAAMA